MAHSNSSPSLWTVILAGGVGSRFWPASTPARPKQVLPLASNQPLIADTVQRIQPLIPIERVRILTGRALGEPILREVEDLGPENLMCEPMAKSTAPALLWAAHEIARQDPEGVMISLHSDHVIEPQENFLALLSQVSQFAFESDRLCTIGIQPTRPETGYGYIRVGNSLAENISAVDQFVEKPNHPTALQYLESGNYLWNSGIFIWKARILLEEVRKHTPELAPLISHLDNGDVDRFFAEAPSVSIDEGVLERSDRIAVARGNTFSWDDVGTWDSVGRTKPSDAAGNVIHGEGRALDSERCIVWAEEHPVVVFGAEDLIVASVNGVVFVAPRSKSAEMKKLFASLPDNLRDL